MDSCINEISAYSQFLEDWIITDLSFTSSSLKPMRAHVGHDHPAGVVVL